MPFDPVDYQPSPVPDPPHAHRHFTKTQRAMFLLVCLFGTMLAVAFLILTLDPAVRSTAR